MNELFERYKIRLKSQSHLPVRELMSDLLCMLSFDGLISNVLAFMHDDDEYKDHDWSLCIEDNDKVIVDYCEKMYDIYTVK